MYVFRGCGPLHGLWVSLSNQVYEPFAYGVLYSVFRASLYMICELLAASRMLGL
jgi:hypothetical protein